MPQKEAGENLKGSPRLDFSRSFSARVIVQEYRRRSADERPPLSARMLACVFFLKVFVSGAAADGDTTAQAQSQQRQRTGFRRGKVGSGRQNKLRVAI